MNIKKVKRDFVEKFIFFVNKRIFSNFLFNFVTFSYKVSLIVNL